MSLRILVSAASKHGSTAEIAERVAETLRTQAPDDTVVDVREAGDVNDVVPYDAVVLGSAVYMGKWLEDARALADRMGSAPPRQVWLFSSGPIGDPPKPEENPHEVAEIVAATHARDHQLFAGRIERSRLGFGERALMMAFRVHDGDYRDWDAIDAWSTQIAADLGERAATPG